MYEPIKDLSTEDRDQYDADIKVMNYILQGIPNDIYNFIDACEDAQGMWQRVKRLMQGTYLSQQERQSRLMNEFDQFAAEAGESLTFAYERFSTLMNNIDRNKVKPKEIDINTKFLKSLQPENGSRNAGRTNKNQATNTGNGFTQKTEENEENVQRIPSTMSTSRKKNVQCYSCNGKGHYVRDCPKPRVCDAKYFREQMLLAAKDEAGVNLDTEENVFMLMNAYGYDHLE
ncbi:integrase, catalytic region, zinc finger, CCHC-type containing protein [Tanacetum coccineum]